MGAATVITNEHLKSRATKMDANTAQSATRFGTNHRKTALTIVVFSSLCHLIILPFSVHCFFIDEHQSPATHKWSYHQQNEWAHEHKQCGWKAQSPIDIQRRYVIHSGQLKLHFYNYNQPTKFIMENSHHTVKLNLVDNALDQLQRQHQFLPAGGPRAHLTAGGRVTNDIANDNAAPDSDDELETVLVAATKLANDTSAPPAHRHHDSRVRFPQANGLSPNGQIGHQQQQEAGNSLLTDSNQQQRQVAYDGKPTIKLDWLDDGNNEYKLHDIHFHWAERRDNGSEHAIDGKRAAMEMHLVHIKHGLDKSKIGFTSDSVTVIAVLIESYRKSNADFNPIINALDRINMTNQAEEVEYKSINDLLPNGLDSFYTYAGSLTTPPCFQVVNWIVMSERLYLNAKQIEMFRNLYRPGSSETIANASPNENGDGGGSAGSDSLEPPLIMPNIRQLQALNNRTILSSFAPLSRLEQIQVASGGSIMPYSGASSLNSTGGMQILFALICMVTFAHNIVNIRRHPN